MQMKNFLPAAAPGVNNGAITIGKPGVTRHFWQGVQHMCYQTVVRGRQLVDTFHMQARHH